jgi:hypothetical protein
MSLSVLLIAALFFMSLILTMVGLGGGLVFSPLFVILGFAKSEAASASLFLNLVAAASAATTYSRKKMVDFSLAIPLIVSSALTAPFGSYLNVHIDVRPFMITPAVVLALAGGRMLISPADEAQDYESPTQGEKHSGHLQHPFIRPVCQADSPGAFCPLALRRSRMISPKVATPFSTSGV